MVQIYGCMLGVPPSVKVGAELLIFAGKTPHSQYGLIEWQQINSQSGRRRLHELGRGRAPKAGLRPTLLPLLPLLQPRHLNRFQLRLI
jgi:hypothetical protein